MSLCSSSLLLHDALDFEYFLSSPSPFLRTWFEAPSASPFLSDLHATKIQSKATTTTRRLVPNKTTGCNAGLRYSLPVHAPSELGLVEITMLLPELMRRLCTRNYLVSLPLSKSVETLPELSRRVGCPPGCWYPSFSTKHGK
jgi:hypothetical protein